MAIMTGHDEEVVIDDPKAIRALAHPRRLQILTLLRDGRPMTVTELARLTEDSTASVSYHVQQLSMYGFIERAEDLARGREKPWRAKYVSYSFEASPDSEASVTAARTMRWAMANRAGRIVNDYLAQEEHLPKEWREAAVISEGGFYLTSEELHEVAVNMLKVLDPYRNRTADQAPPDSRYSHIILYGIPSATQLGVPI
jgi:DNA-binding transcriptional ArsR family regulator